MIQWGDTRLSSPHGLRMSEKPGWLDKIKMSFHVQIVLFEPNIPPPPHVNFGNFQVEEIFSFLKFLGGLDEKRAAATP